MTAAELAELDLAVAKAEGLEVDATHLKYGRLYIRVTGETASGPRSFWKEYHPTRDGVEAMRLLEKYRLTVTTNSRHGWTVYDQSDAPHFGPTPAIAICRAVVALKGAA